MEIKIKDQDKLLDVTIEMVDGVMVVSPKEVKQDVSQFNTGDILVCGWKDTTKTCEWVCILDGRVEKQSHTQYFLEDFCGMYTKGCNGDKEIWLEPSFSDSATYVRCAAEKEKQTLFDRLAEEGYEWNSDTKQLVKIKWKPKDEEEYHYPSFISSKFESLVGLWVKDELDYKMLDEGWVFRTKEECQEFCDKLNKAINSVKP